MSLKEILAVSEKKKNHNKLTEITEEHLDAHFNEVCNGIAFFRAYPDIFVDLIKGENCTFKFYYYQRIYLRAAMRHRNLYATFPRG